MIRTPNICLDLNNPRILPTMARSKTDGGAGSRAERVHRGQIRQVTSVTPPKARLRFKNREECLPAELFFDLWFVANLNTFTTSYEISTSHALLSYVGFFGLLWLTVSPPSYHRVVPSADLSKTSQWSQISTFDIRLSSDSVFDRVMKALQLGVGDPLNVLLECAFETNNVS